MLSLLEFLYKTELQEVMWKASVTVNEHTGGEGDTAFKDQSHLNKTAM
jgi:hypothetical protein